MPLEFQSMFQKRYVGGEGEVVLGEPMKTEGLPAIDVEAEIARYRRYVGVSVDEVSDEQIAESLGMIKKTV
jgi:hypothetical protein